MAMAVMTSQNLGQGMLTFTWFCVECGSNDVGSWSTGAVPIPIPGTKAPDIYPAKGPMPPTLEKYFFHFLLIFFLTLFGNIWPVWTILGNFWARQKIGQKWPQKIRDPHRKDKRQSFVSKKWSQNFEKKLKKSLLRPILCHAILSSFCRF